MSEAMVGALGVVEDEPIGEFLVAQFKVGKEQVLVVVDEGSAMPSFTVWTKVASNSVPLSESSTWGLVGSRLKPACRAAWVWRVAQREG